MHVAVYCKLHVLKTDLTLYIYSRTLLLCKLGRCIWVDVYRMCFPVTQTHVDTDQDSVKLEYLLKDLLTNVFSCFWSILLT